MPFLNQYINEFTPILKIPVIQIKAPNLLVLDHYAFSIRELLILPPEQIFTNWCCNRIFSDEAQKIIRNTKALRSQVLAYDVLFNNSSRQSQQIRLLHINLEKCFTLEQKKEYFKQFIANLNNYTFLESSKMYNFAVIIDRQVIRFSNLIQQNNNFSIQLFEEQLAHFIAHIPAIEPPAAPKETIDLTLNGSEETTSTPISEFARLERFLLDGNPLTTYEPLPQTTQPIVSTNQNLNNQPTKSKAKTQLTKHNNGFFAAAANSSHSRRRELYFD